jgi:glycolate oxidase iron-sulfur subunit
MDTKELVDYSKSLDCIHCGLCLRTCPTYRLSGVESSSPRGRIYMMRAVAEEKLDITDPDFREEMDFCLVCRHCESVCPAGVRFGEMMETTRASIESTTKRPALERFARWLGFRVVLPSRAWLKLSMSALRLAQVTGLLKLVAPLAGERGRSLLTFPRVPPASERRALASTTPAKGQKRGAVALLEGCVMRELYGRVNRATADVLAANGFESRVPSDHVCCGALHAHNGDLDGAKELARSTIERFDALDSSLPIVVNSAGCGAHMKEYGRLLAGDSQWATRAKLFSARVKDFSEFVAARASDAWQPKLDANALPGAIAYDDPCHLCHGQQIRSQPRALLDRVAGLQRVELPESESCCGSAGIYSVLRPRDSQAVFAGKLKTLEECGARVLVTANPGCHLQWESGLARANSAVRVMHIAEVLALAEHEHEHERV